MLKSIKNLFVKKERRTVGQEYVELAQRQTQFLEKTIENYNDDTKLINEYLDKLNERIDKAIEEKKQQEKEKYSNINEYIDKSIKELNELKEDLELYKSEFPEEYEKMFGSKEEDYSEYNNVVSLSNYRRKH